MLAMKERTAPASVQKSREPAITSTIATAVTALLVVFGVYAANLVIYAAGRIESANVGHQIQSDGAAFC